MSLTLERIEALAPDQASLAAARKLLKPSSWPTLAHAEGLVWGECQGSGATPYRVVVNEADAGYKCTCPSRKFPCKHSLALMWMRADKSSAFVSAPVPEWVKDCGECFVLSPCEEPHKNGQCLACTCRQSNLTRYMSREECDEQIDLPLPRLKRCDKFESLFEASDCFLRTF